MREVDKSLWPPTCHGRWMSEEYEPGLVSVIVPTYNRAHFLAEALDSVWAQTYRPIELLVVDDGSTDNTQQLLADWSAAHAADPQFTLRTFRQPNRGAPAARNLGLIESRGEFIQFLDSDDLLSTTKIAAQVGELAKLSRCLVYGGWRRGTSPEVIRATGGPVPADGDFLAYFRRRSFVACHAILWPRAAICAIGPWRESLAAGQDGGSAIRVRNHYSQAKTGVN